MTTTTYADGTSDSRISLPPPQIREQEQAEGRGVDDDRGGVLALLRNRSASGRVALAIAQLDVEIAGMAHAGPSTRRATRYRNIAATFARRGSLDEAWAAVKAAERELIAALSPEELQAEGARIALEADAKLTGWRADFVRAQLADGQSGDPSGGDTDPSLGSNVSAHTLMQCRRVLDDASDTVYRKLGMLRRRLRWSALSLIGSLLLVLTTWLAAVATGVGPSSHAHLLDDWSSILVVLSLGALGAALSGLLSVRDRTFEGRVPDLRLSGILLVWRPVVGASSAFVLVLIVQSGVAGLALDSSAALVGALIAGTTEQVVTYAIGNAGAAIKAGGAISTEPTAGGDRRNGGLTR